ncbi:sigma-54-dependent transcriptional regulator [Agaribacterium haliotis]|uniref:sigma-54-dependent transcriptional regulator n=1 Tax=Agaribacterium haliotis TaxID=2013869 RepID=UPI000BB54053|nr:sigma-54 dependent transcriptional regulator [Agaribacterium haliotis]
MSKVLVIDDNSAVCEAIRHLLALNDIDSIYALTPQAGLKYLREDEDIDLVIQDMNFSEDTTSGCEGELLYRSIRSLQADIPVMLMTSWTQVEAAVALVKGGAADYFSKPWDNNKLLLSVKNFLELRELQREKQKKEQALMDSRMGLQKKYDLCGLVYFSESMHRLVDIATRIAASSASVIISGPNGSGKKKIAEIIQKNSRRNKQAFIRVNIAALPRESMEAELFGAELGTFPDANKNRVGLLERAHAGTVFLDEIDKLSLEAQVKLLNLLQTGELERQGSNEIVKVDVRVISATNADLKQVIEAGGFREDLFYRLNVIELELPALKQRREDILPLIFHFLGSVYSLAPDAPKALQNYDWPGNVSELENCVERAKLLAADKELHISDFSIDVRKNKRAASPVFVEPSKDIIEAALELSGGVVSVAARQLGLSRQALYRRMERYDLHKNN